MEKGDCVKIQTGGVMRDLTVDELLAQMFRDTANRIGWNVYRKGKRCFVPLKRNKSASNLKKLH
jgi:hypothetical protein